MTSITATYIPHKRSPYPSSAAQSYANARLQQMNGHHHPTIIIIVSAHGAAQHTPLHRLQGVSARQKAGTELLC